jgi:chromosome segregation ATPase
VREARATAYQLQEEVKVWEVASEEWKRAVTQREARIQELETILTYTQGERDDAQARVIRLREENAKIVAGIKEAEETGILAHLREELTRAVAWVRELENRVKEALAERDSIKLQRDALSEQGVSYRAEITQLRKENAKLQAWFVNPGAQRPTPVSLPPEQDPQYLHLVLTAIRELLDGEGTNARLIDTMGRTSGTYIKVGTPWE